MNKYVFSFVMVLFCGGCAHSRLPASAEEPLLCTKYPKFTIAIHVGTGSEGSEEFGRSLLEAASRKARDGASGLDVVEFVIREMENSGKFNSGKGAITNSEGVVELDASIMEGKHLRAGAVAGVKTLRNPISAARLVMRASTFADNQTCAVSTSGRGEDFTRLNISHDISARMKYKKISLMQAASEAVNNLASHGGIGGVIAIDGDGDFVNKSMVAMGTAYIKQDGKVHFGE